MARAAAPTYYSGSLQARPDPDRSRPEDAPLTRPEPLRTLRYLGIALLVLAAGVLGLALVFLDLGVPTSPGQRAVVAAVYFFLAGCLCGILVRPGRAWLVAVLLTWAVTLLGLVGLFVSARNPESADPALAVKLLLGPVLCSLAGVAAARFARDRLGSSEPPTGRR